MDTEKESAEDMRQGSANFMALQFHSVGTYHARMTFRRIAPFLVLVLTFGIYAVWLAYPIALVTADIGRHIMNGEVVLRFPELFRGLTQTNFYTYTHPDFAAVNHHWLGGLFFRMMFSMGGWTWLHVSFIVLHLLTLAILVDAGRRIGSFPAAAITALAALPLAGERFEVRPEGFGYFLFAVVFWLLIARERGVIAKKFLWVLPVLFALWANVHASFPVGFVLVSAFFVREVFRKHEEGESNIRLYAGLFAACIAATFLNPNGLRGVIEPFLIFRDPGYAVVENQSVFFLESLGVEKGSFLFLKIWTVLLVAAAFIALRKRSETLISVLLLLALALAALSFMAARNITMLGFALVPVAAAFVASLQGTERRSSIAMAVLSVVAVASLGWFASEFRHRWIVIGLAPGANGAADFMKENAITGPFFNDFDIAGYLIYHFFPQEKVFVSNVPEAHPADFFSDVYIPMHQDNAVWYREMDKYGFNAIVVYYRERTQWMPEFLRARLADAEWAPVYADDAVLIFLRRNEKNSAVISRHQIPASAFQFGSN